MSRRAAKPSAPPPPFEESALRVQHREAPAKCAAIEAWFFSRPAVVARMAELPHLVQDEVRNEVRGRAMGAAMQGRDRIDWSAGAVDECRARVISRLRVHKFGRAPDDPTEYARQRAECEAMLT